MAENDIYNSKIKYENFKQNYRESLIESTSKRKHKHYCKNKKNLDYFEPLFNLYEAKDLSYIRRIRLNMTLKLILASTEKDLAECDRDDINSIVAFMHNQYNSPKSKSYFIRDIKYLWKHLFPEKDERGRIDDTLVPYNVRHLSPKIDKSKEKRRKDKMTFEEFENIVQYFAKDPQMQFYLTFSNESLVRPQEACYLKIGDVELHDNYAKIYLSEHGKEGVHGFLRCIDSFPYLVKWLEQHPFKNNKDSFLLISQSDRNKGAQQKPNNFNLRLRNACKILKIGKPITTYSLKRNGVSFKRLAGYSDVEIQHIARLTSTKQRKTYDLTDADDTFKRALLKKGLIKADEKSQEVMPSLKECNFCGKQNAFTSLVCDNCKRPLNRVEIEKEEMRTATEMNDLKSQLDEVKEMLMKIATNEVNQNVTR